VTGALLTGARYGELAAMKAGDFDPQAATVRIGQSKSGKPRHVALTKEGKDFFEQMATCKAGSARLFERDQIVTQATRKKPTETKRAAWGKSDQSG
jgi:integrase